MSIDISTENIIDLRDTAKMPVFRNARSGKAAHMSQLYRWTTGSGARAADGTRVRLATIRTPSGLRTSVEAVERFIHALTEGDGEPMSVRTSRQRQRAAEQAKRELAASGIR
jgi:hypothetical protein